MCHTLVWEWYKIITKLFALIGRLNKNSLFTFEFPLYYHPLNALWYILSVMFGTEYNIYFGQIWPQMHKESSLQPRLGIKLIYLWWAEDGSMWFIEQRSERNKQHFCSKSKSNQPQSRYQIKNRSFENVPLLSVTCQCSDVEGKLQNDHLNQ